MKLFVSLIIGSQVAAETASCPETHPFESKTRSVLYFGPANHFCCEGYGSCGGQIGCTTEECEDYVATDTCLPAYPFPHEGPDNWLCCKTAELTSCNVGSVDCNVGSADDCQAYVAPSSDGKNLQF